MGRTSWSNRMIVEDCRNIDIPWLKRHGYLDGFKAGGIEWRNSSGEVTSSIGIEVSTIGDNPEKNYIRFQYTIKDHFSGEKKEFDYKFNLVKTPCYFGGRRYWFICDLTTNGRYCGRRVAKLYLPPGGKYFGCRHCCNLTYRCQKEHDKKVDALTKNPHLLISMINSPNNADPINNK